MVASPDSLRTVIPAAIRERLRLLDGSLHLSAELRGSLDLDDLLARLEEELGPVPRVWHTPDRFARRFGPGLSPAPFPARRPSPVSQTWVDDYVRSLFQRAMARKATDVHITYMGPYAQVAFRRLGLMQEEETLEGARGIQLIRGIFQSRLSQADSGFSEHERCDGRIADRRFLPEGLFAVRLHTEPVQSPLLPTPGVTLAMRLLFDGAGVSGTLPERLAALGFTPEQRGLIESFTETAGMTVVSGPTGHGKTTVLKNILEALACDFPHRNYCSLEDPPEYSILGVRQLSVCTRQTSEADRRRALVEALAGLMRSDPDVILLGEIRYLEAAQAAVSAALTGHAVWTTVHAGSALGVLDRLREMGLPPESLLAEGVLTGLVCQRLLPLLCPSCSLPLPGNLRLLPPRLAARLGRLFPRGELDGMRLRGPGCPACDGLGLRGMRVAAEVVPLKEPGLLALLRRGRLEEARRFWTDEMGGLSHQAHARLRVASGQVDPRLAEERLGSPLDADLAGVSPC